MFGRFAADRLCAKTNSRIGSVIEMRVRSFIGTSVVVSVLSAVSNDGNDNQTLIVPVLAPVRTHGVFVVDQFQSSAPIIRFGADKTISHWLRRTRRAEPRDFGSRFRRTLAYCLSGTEV